MDKVVQKAIAKDKRWRADYIACGLLIVALTLFMGPSCSTKAARPSLRRTTAFGSSCLPVTGHRLTRPACSGEKLGLPFTSLVPWKPACWVCSSACRSRSAQPFS